MENKEQQKNLIVEIMNEDQKDGLYKKQTAVEWLVEQFEKWSHEGNFIPNHLAEQAKQMEKEQMCKFAYKCHNHYKVYGDFKIDQYYNETFKSE